MAGEGKPKQQKRRTGLYVVIGGITMLILGYLLLAQGSITAAPLLIVGSLGVLVVGIFLGWD